jgi:carboxypeptidase Q
MWGSDVLEMAIGWLKQQAELENFENVRLEPVRNFTKWVRGSERLTMTNPRPFETDLDVTTLGGSVGCNITADVVVVSSFDELKTANVSGKIVCFNNPWVDYATSV